MHDYRLSLWILKKKSFCYQFIVNQRILSDLCTSLKKMCEYMDFKITSNNYF